MAGERIVVGLSGGVDSAVAAALLVERGHEVHGLFMRNWAEDDAYCTAAADYQDARRVCQELDIPLHQVDFSSEYRQRVFEHFLAELRAGRTPNPDVLCNREIKFGVCLDYARRLGAMRFATGHYARTCVEAGQAALLRGIDPGKDQAYFLHTLDAATLAAVEFPVGALPKAEVRRLAHERALPVHDKRDSTGICFIGERPFAEFLAGYLPAQPGDIEDLAGRRLGRHRGLMYYTVGQRQGLEIGGLRDAAEAPWYVARKDLGRNVLLVVQGNQHPELYTQQLHTETAHWIAGRPPATSFECTVQLRHRQAPQDCTVKVREDGGCELHCDRPQRAVAAGQSAVFYRGDLCLGGAVIL
jgi:tRNA-specific 2-thiouridylase